MARIFISYRRTDEAFARQLATSLSNAGADVWIDVDDIPAGMKWSTAIQEGLRTCDVLIVIITSESMASRNVEDEWQFFLAEGKLIVPVLLRQAQVHFQLRGIQYVDFKSQPYDVAFAQLHAELRRQGVDLRPLATSAPSVPLPDKSTRETGVPPRTGGRVLWPIAAVIALLVVAGIILALSGVFGGGDGDGGPDAVDRSNTPVPPETRVVLDITATAAVTATYQAMATNVMGTAMAGWTATPADTPTEKPTGIPVIMVGMTANYSPFEFVDEDGNIVGFDVDLLKAVAEVSGFEFEIVNTSWNGIFVALAADEFDMVISAAAITEEREELVDFTAPYFDAGQWIVVRETDADSIRSVDDLPGHMVGVQTGTTGDIAAGEVEDVIVIRYEEIALAFQALAAGEVDAVVNDGPVSADFIKRNPQLGLMQVEKPLTVEYYGIAVAPGKSWLVDVLNTALAVVSADGTYAEIYREWFGVDPPAEFMPPE